MNMQSPILLFISNSPIFIDILLIFNVRPDFIILVQVKRVNHVTNFFPQSFMFESSLSLKSTTWALKTCEKVDDDYWKCWQNLPKLFNPNQK